MRRLRFPGLLAVLAMMLAACDSTTSHFVTGLPTIPPPSPFAGVGPIGLAFDSADHLLVADAPNLGLYSFGSGGSNDPQPISTGNAQGGLTFAKTGQFFGVRYQAGDLNQLDPATGAIIRRLNPPNTTYPCILGLATDPISGDLFFSQPNSGGVCPGSTKITRVANPTSANPVFTTYIDLAPASADGLAFGPDGTLYAVVQSGTLGCAARISGTSRSTPPTLTTIACVTGPGDLAGIDAITASARPRSRPTLFVSGPDGTIRQIDQSTAPATVTAIVTGGTTGQGLTIGPDGCLYVTQSTTIDKVAPANGRCSLVPVSALPVLRLRPDTIDPALIGRSVTVRAKLDSSASGSPRQITFTVTGANPTSRTVNTDRSDTATFTYSGIHAGNNTITATATVGSTALVSNPTTVHWQVPPPSGP